MVLSRAVRTAEWTVQRMAWMMAVQKASLRVDVKVWRKGKMLVVGRVDLTGVHWAAQTAGSWAVPSGSLMVAMTAELTAVLKACSRAVHWVVRSDRSRVEKWGVSRADPLACNLAARTVKKLDVWKDRNWVAMWVLTRAEYLVGPMVVLKAVQRAELWVKKKVGSTGNLTAAWKARN
jgi:hypothetical protein